MAELERRVYRPAPDVATTADPGSRRLDDLAAGLSRAIHDDVLVRTGEGNLAGAIVVQNRQGCVIVPLQPVVDVLEEHLVQHADDVAGRGGRIRV